MDPLTLSINKALLELRDEPSEIQRQLLLIPKDQLAHDAGSPTWLTFREIQALPIAKAIALLPIARKIAALTCVRGSLFVHKLLHIEGQLDAVETFSKQFDQIVGGCLNTYCLDGLGALRMLFFAELARLSEKKSIPKLAEHSANAKALFALLSESTGNFETIKKFPLTNFQEMMQFFEGHAPKVLPTLQLLKTVYHAPSVYLPLLLDPLRTRHVSLPLEHTLNYIDRRIKSWLPDFWLAWKWQGEQFFSAYLPKEKALRGSFDTYIAQGKALSNEILKLFTTYQEYEQLTPVKRWKSQEKIGVIVAVCERLTQERRQLMSEWSSLEKQLFNKSSRISSGMFPSQIVFPYEGFMELATSVINSIGHFCHDEASFNKWIETILDPKVQADGVHYSCRSSSAAESKLILSYV